jgi:hypothetical protein
VLVTGERYLRPVLGEYTSRCNARRPHRALGQSPPAGHTHPPALSATVRVLRWDRLGGPIHEYLRVAYGDGVFGTHRHVLPCTRGAPRTRGA